MDMMPNSKWACCVGFENLMQRRKKGVWRGVGRCSEKNGV